MVGLPFDIRTPLGFRVRCSRSYWEDVILMKHPVLAGREAQVAAALADPDVVRRSRKDHAVLLFYRREGARWLCVVARAQGAAAFLVTAYPTDAIKIGEPVWTRSR